MGYMLFIERIGYCPMVDTYVDPEKQAEHAKKKQSADRKRVGQQKQRKKGKK